MIIFMLLVATEAAELMRVSRVHEQQDGQLSTLGSSQNRTDSSVWRYSYNSIPPIYNNKGEDFLNFPSFKWRYIHRRVPRSTKTKRIKEYDQRYSYSKLYPDDSSSTPKTIRVSSTTQTLDIDTEVSRHVNSPFPVVNGPGNSTEKGTKYTYNPLYPVTDSSYSAYGVMFLSLIMFALGIVGNLAVMCIVWHNYYMKSAWNCILASWAFWDFLVLFFCLPVVAFNEITKTRLLGDISCKTVPYLEVSAQGVSTFTLCALAIDRFHAATSMHPKAQQLEPCQSILAKLAVVWVGSMILGLPELLLWQLSQDTSVPPGGLEDTCTMKPSLSLPESVYSLALTYHDARMWWHFGCYFCLPVLFTLSCQLVTRHISGSSSGPAFPTGLKQVERHGSRRLDSVVTALALAYAVCTLPGCGCNAVLGYGSAHMSQAARALLTLIGHFLLFARASVTPMLLLCLCRPLGRAFMDCCCCCCDGCLSEGGSSAPPTPSTPSTASSNASTVESQQSHTTEPPPPVLLKVRRSPSEMAIGTPC